MRKTIEPVVIALLLVVIFLVSLATATEYPLTITDMGGHRLVLKEKPRRIVSVVPSATDAIFGVGAHDLLVGRTYHNTYPAAINDKPIVGGFFRPSIRAVKELKPDLIFLSRLQRDLREQFAGSGVALVEIDTRSMNDGYRMMELIGRIVDKEQPAAELIKKIKGQIDYVQRKVAKIPKEKRKRVMRLMGMTTVMTPGDDSFQNEFIRAAGGIPPSLGKKGPVVKMTKEEWERFNPQLIYYCGKEWELSKKYFDKAGWKDVDAVRHKSYAHFPCNLTCRASVHMGKFIGWLASVIYADRFYPDESAISEEKLVGMKKIELPLPYVKSAVIADSVFRDFRNRTLLIDFTKPMQCISTLEGPVKSAETVGNHSLPLPLWRFPHSVPLSQLKTMLCGILNRDPARTSLLYTGARIECLSVQRRSYKDMIVYALVTAGVEANAIRAGVDVGNYYEPGTINIIVLTNRQLTPRAMTRAIVAATEAKTAALQDLDVRSSYSTSAQATGTGTDNIIVVEGQGPRVDNAGGHSKMGELVAKAVYAGVTESLQKQNGFVNTRNVFRRMRERKIDAYGITAKCPNIPRREWLRMASGLEKLLMQPEYAGFLEAAFALNDAHQSQLVCDLTEFKRECAQVTDRIAGRHVPARKQFLPQDAAPEVIRMAFEALLSGLHSSSVTSTNCETAPQAASKDDPVDARQ